MIREQEADRLALVEEGKEYTYGELVKLSQEKGDRLRQEKSEKKVIFLREKRILDQLVSFLGLSGGRKDPASCSGGCKTIAGDRRSAGKCLHGSDDFGEYRSAEGTLSKVRELGGFFSGSK